MHLSRRQFLAHSATVSALAAGGCATVISAPDALIVDTHQHLWDLATQKLPWLGGAPEILRHSYRTEEYRAATAGLNVRAIYMEVDVAESALVAEAEFVLGVGARRPNAHLRGGHRRPTGRAGLRGLPEAFPGQPVFQGRAPRAPLSRHPQRATA